MTPVPTDDLAASLAEAHDTATPVDPAALAAIDSVETGYRVQERLVELLGASRGGPVGYKIGFTNERVRADLGVDEPGYGRLLADTVRSSPATAHAADYVALRVEPEIAFRLGDDLPAGGTRRDAREAVETVLPALELVDSRTDWVFDAPVTVADNSLDAGLVVGDGRDLGGIALAEEAVTLRVDGCPVASGVGSDVLGNPLAALSWLADAVDGVAAGALVTTGSLTEPLAVEAGETLTASFASLGEAELRVE